MISFTHFQFSKIENGKQSINQKMSLHQYDLHEGKWCLEKNEECIIEYRGKLYLLNTDGITNITGITGIGWDIKQLPCGPLHLIADSCKRKMIIGRIVYYDDDNIWHGEYRMKISDFVSELYNYADALELTELTDEEKEKYDMLSKHGIGLILKDNLELCNIRNADEHWAKYLYDIDLENYVNAEPASHKLYHAIMTLQNAEKYVALGYLNNTFTFLPNNPLHPWPPTKEVTILEHYLTYGFYDPNYIDINLLKILKMYTKNSGTIMGDFNKKVVILKRIISIS